MKKATCYNAFCEIAELSVAFLSFAAKFWSFSLLYSGHSCSYTPKANVNWRTSQNKRLNFLLEQKAGSRVIQNGNIWFLEVNSRLLNWWVDTRITVNQNLHISKFQLVNKQQVSEMWNGTREFLKCAITCFMIKNQTKPFVDKAVLCSFNSTTFKGNSLDFHIWNFLPVSEFVLFILLLPYWWIFKLSYWLSRIKIQLCCSTEIVPNLHQHVPMNC